MSTENLSAFFSQVGNDPALAAKVASTKNLSKDEKAAALAQLSEETGTPFTAEELLTFFATPLSDEELSGIAGGMVLHAKHNSQEPSERVEIPKSKWTLDELGDAARRLPGIRMISNLFN